MNNSWRQPLQRPARKQPLPISYPRPGGVVLLSFVFAALSLNADTKSGQLPENVTFNAHIRPIMSNTCFVCHGPDDEQNESGYRLDSFAAATAPLPSDDERQGIVPGNALASEVYLRILGISEDGPRMPPEDFRHSLTERDRALIGRWIEQGAAYQQHWSFAPIATHK